MSNDDARNHALEIGTRLVERCRAGEFQKALDELYADDAVSIEAMAGPHGRIVEGKQRLLEMGEEWMQTNEVHGCTVDGPFPNGDGDAFICFMSIDVTPSAGPMAGERMTMSEACCYRVANGRIARAEFFYPPVG